MSLVVTVYVPTGVVLSADSRTIVSRAVERRGEGSTQRDVTSLVLSDATEKLLVVHERFAVGTWGAAFVGDLPVAHHIRTLEHESRVPESVEGMAEQLLERFAGSEPAPSLYFAVAGYDGGVPWVLTVDVSGRKIARTNADDSGRVAYGITRGGDADIANRLLSNERLMPPFQLMNVQDAVDYSRHLIRTTIDEMRFEPMIPTVGGPIDTLVLGIGGTPEWLARKELRPA